MESFLSPTCSPDEAHGKLVHIFPKKDFEEYDAIFASEALGEKILAGLLDKLNFKQRNFLISTINIEGMATLRGILAENTFHAILLRGGSFQIRELEVGNGDILAQRTIVFPETRKVKFSTQNLSDLDTFGPGMYAQPNMPNLTALDAFTIVPLRLLEEGADHDKYCLLGFQMTLTGESGNRRPRHGLKVAGLITIIEKVRYLNPKLTIVPAVAFTVSQRTAKEFRIQNFTAVGGKKYAKTLPKVLQGIKQYVLTIKDAHMAPIAPESTTGTEIRALLGDQA